MYFKDKTRSITIRLSVDEYNLLYSQAERLNISFSDLTRKLLFLSLNKGDSKNDEKNNVNN